MQKPADIVNREVEWKKLVELWEDPAGHLIFMHGRRRVGKSWLLHRFAQAVGGIYYQATRGTRREQINRLTRVVGEHFEDPILTAGAELPGWQELFEYVTDKAGEQPLLFIIDEFPFLADESPELTSILQTLWDHRWKESTFKMLLCGSHVTLMKQLEEYDQPLHGRRTARIAISPFIYRDIAAILPEWDSRDQLLTYAIFGGLPGHLDRIDPRRTLAENVGRLILDPSSRLYDEATHLLDSFGREADVHYSTLFAIATGARTWGKITDKVSRSGGALWPVIEWLQEMELVERQVPVTHDQPHKSKVSLYRLTDPYLRFWYRFVQPIYSSGSSGMATTDTLWKSRIEPRLDDYMGEVFEDICHDFVKTYLELPFDALRIGRWWTRDSQHEVDIVVRGTDGALFVGECKWGGVTGADLKKLRQRAQMIAGELDEVGEIHYALFSGADEHDKRVAEAVEAGEVSYYGLDQLFE